MKILLLLLVLLSFDAFGINKICEGEKYVSIRHNDISQENAVLIADLALKDIGATYDESGRVYSYTGEPSNVVHFKLDFEYGDEVRIMNFIKCGSENNDTYNKKIKLMNQIVQKLKHIVKRENYSIDESQELDSIIFIMEKPIFD